MSTNPFANQTNDLGPGSADLRVGFGLRLAAWAIDVLVTIFFALGLSFLLMNFHVGQTEELASTIEGLRSLYDSMGISTDFLDAMQSWLGAWVLATIIANISYSLIEGLTGASPGKRVLHIYIANANGSRPSLGTLLGRWAVKNVGSITTFIALVPALSVIESVGTILSLVVFGGCFFVLSQNKQALHDMVAQTAVYHH